MGLDQRAKKLDMSEKPVTHLKRLSSKFESISSCERVEAYTSTPSGSGQGGGLADLYSDDQRQGLRASFGASKPLRAFERLPKWT